MVPISQQKMMRAPHNWAQREAAQLSDGGKVHIQDHDKGCFYLHQIDTSGPGFLMVDAEGGAASSGGAAGAPRSKSGGSNRPKAGPIATMTAGELLRSAGADGRNDGA